MKRQVQIDCKLSRLYMRAKLGIVLKALGRNFEADAAYAQPK